MRRFLIMGLLAACALVGASAVASADGYPDVTPPTYGPSQPLCSGASTTDCVEVAGSSTSFSDLAYTGGDTNLLVGIGVGTLLTGAFLVVVGNRRRHATVRS